MQDYHSATNQNILRQLIEREVYCCLSDIVSELIEAEKIDIWELPGFDAKAEWEGEEITEAQRDEKVEELSELLDEIEDQEDESATRLSTQIEALEALEFDTYPELYEWWGVSGWFCEKLKERGEVVCENYGTSLWGRQTTGQAILLDSVIGRIAKEMEILEGMKNSWA